MFGGRNKDSEIIGDLIMYPIYISEGQLHFNEGIKIGQDKLEACQFPIVKGLDYGILILGGINNNNEATNQNWYFNSETKALQKIETNI